MVECSNSKSIKNQWEILLWCNDGLSIGKQLWLFWFPHIPPSKLCDTNVTKICIDAPLNLANTFVAKTKNLGHLHDPNHWLMSSSLFQIATVVICQLSKTDAWILTCQIAPTEMCQLAKTSKMPKWKFAQISVNASFVLSFSCFWFFWEGQRCQ